MKLWGTQKKKRNKSPFLEAVALMYSLGVQLRHTIPEPMEYNCPEKPLMAILGYYQKIKYHHRMSEHILGNIIF